MCKIEKQIEVFYNIYAECKEINCNRGYKRFYDKRGLKRYYENKNKRSNHQEIYSEKNSEKLLQKQNKRSISFRELQRSKIELQKRLKAFEEKFSTNDSENIFYINEFYSKQPLSYLKELSY